MALYEVTGLITINGNDTTFVVNTTADGKEEAKANAFIHFARPQVGRRFSNVKISGCENLDKKTKMLGENNGNY